MMMSQIFCGVCDNIPNNNLNSISKLVEKKNMKHPLVSCIMPTANREKFIPFAIEYFLAQNYDRKQLVIVDDGLRSIAHLLPKTDQISYYYTKPIETIGLKRNYAIKKAHGEIIVHWDDDDWHAYDWVTNQVNFLNSSCADITGIKHVHYFSPLMNKVWLGDASTESNPSTPTWLNGATLAFWKSYWEKHQFKNLQKGEDDEFISHTDAKIFAHDYIDGFVAILHTDNTTVKSFESPKNKRNAR
jgi:glycosyltransferase involved in cell wall biosynthesis